MNSRKIILAKNPKLANSRNSRKFLPKISRIFPLAKVSSFKVYRIASNKRPTSRKRLPLINAPFLKGKNVRNEEKKLLFFYYLQKYRNGCNAV